MARLSVTGSGDVKEISNIISNDVLNSGMSCQLVDEIYRNSNGFEVSVKVFEKYFMRAGNRVSLTVVVTGSNGDVFVDAVGAGGGQGPVFKFSLGSEENFVSVVEQSLRKLEFIK